MSSPSLQRRDFFTKGLAIGGGLALGQGLAAPAFAESKAKIKWRLTSSYPKSLDAIFGTSLFFSNRVAEMTNGEFQIQIFAPQEIAPAMEALHVVSNGAVEMCHTSSYYYVGKNEAFAFGTTIPFGMNTRQSLSWYHEGGGQQILQEFYDKHNVQFFVCGSTTAQMGGWFRKPIDKVNDLKGLTFRIAGLTGRILEQLGVIPQQIPGGDIYPALEKGTIDAAEWIGPYDDEKLGFHKVAKYYYYPGWWEGGPLLGLFINQKAWQSLPKDYQAIVRAAAAESTHHLIGQYDKYNPIALRRIAASGVELRPFSQEIMAECFKIADKLYEELAVSNLDFGKIWRPYKAYMKEVSLWHRFCEHPYDRFSLYDTYLK